MSWRRLKKSQTPINKAKKVINDIASVLKRRDFVEAVGIQVTEVFLGGSVGQGTAVHRQYDVDIVLYSRDLHYQDAIADEYYKEFLKKINEFLQENLGKSYTYIGETDVALEFNYRLPEGGDLDVDLLLSPYWESKEHLFSDLAEVQPPIKRLRFSASTSKYQTDFIRHLRGLNLSQRQTSRVKELIRRAKAWRNRSWMEDKRGKPKSYLMSMLVITAYHRLHGSEHELSRINFAALSRRVADEMKILINEIATNDKLNLVIPGTEPSITETYAHLLPDRPRIVDPVNPTNNLYLSGIGPDPYGEGTGKWSKFVQKIKGIDLSLSKRKIHK